MKNVKIMIAIITLVSILGIGNAYGADSTTSSTGSWFGGVYSYIASYFTATSATSTESVQTRADKLAANHNETLVSDEN